MDGSSLDTHHSSLEFGVMVREQTQTFPHSLRKTFQKAQTERVLDTLITLAQGFVLEGGVVVETQCLSTGLYITGISCMNTT